MDAILEDSFRHANIWRKVTMNQKNGTGLVMLLFSCSVLLNSQGTYQQSNHANPFLWRGMEATSKEAWNNISELIGIWLSWPTKLMRLYDFKVNMRGFFNIRNEKIVVLLMLLDCRFYHFVQLVALARNPGSWSTTACSFVPLLDAVCTVMEILASHNIISWLIAVNALLGIKGHRIHRFFLQGTYLDTSLWEWNLLPL